MSGTTPSQVAAGRRVGEYGTVIVSIVTLGTFLAALIYAYAKNDANSINLLVGAIIANATTTVGFWLGSSRGSQQKDVELSSIASTNRPPPLTAGGFSATVGVETERRTQPPP